MMIHGTQLRLVTATFTEAYLRAVQSPCQQHSGRTSAGRNLPKGSKRGTKNAVRTGKIHPKRPGRAGTTEACVKRACGGLLLTLYILLFSPDRKAATRSLLSYQFPEYCRRVVRDKYLSTLALSYLNNKNAFCYTKDERTNQSKPKVMKGTGLAIANE